MSKIEQQFGEDIYLNEYTGYDRESLVSLSNQLFKLLSEAETSGLTNVHVRFASTSDPYDNMLGPVEVQIRGDRELNSYEKAQQQEQDRIQALADKLGITFYEASVVDRLEKQKKVKL